MPIFCIPHLVMQMQSILSLNHTYIIYNAQLPIILFLSPLKWAIHQHQADFNSMHSIGGSVVEFSPATRGARVQFPADAMQVLLTFPNCARTFSGHLPLLVIPCHSLSKMTEHVQHCLSVQNVEHKSFVGDGGYRSPYLSHAKRALYHLSYVPMLADGHAQRLSDIQN